MSFSVSMTRPIPSLKLCWLSWKVSHPRQSLILSNFAQLIALRWVTLWLVSRFVSDVSDL